jgi:hypothetical protein
VLAALERGPAAIALIDGVFEASPTVWHRELLLAIERGVAVFGASSMGALRASELDAEGMIGVGTIYGWFRDGRIEDDAEVALLHADAEHDFRALTLPLVNVRHAAQRARTAKVLRPAEAQALIAAAAGCFYADRSWARILETVSWSTATRARWDAFAARGLEDLKALDARACLDTALGFVRSGGRLPPRPPSPESSWSRWLALDAAAGDGSAADTERVLARKTLAGLARGFGLDTVWPQAWTEESLASEVLEAAVRLLPDGPSRAEASATARLEAQRARRQHRHRGKR